MFAVLMNPPRRRRRGRRHKTRSRRRRRNYSHWIPSYGENPRRRRGRRGRRRRGRNRRSASYNYRRRRRNPYWVPSYAMNPASVMGAITAGYSPKVLKEALPLAGGAIGNAAFAGFVSRYMPSILQDGLGAIVLSLGTAGVLGAGVGMLNPSWGAPVFMGGVIEAVTRAVRSYMMPVFGKLKGLSGCCGGGMGNYATWLETGDYLPDYSEATGLNDTGVIGYAAASGLNPYPYGMQGMGDYLTMNNVNEARPLGDYLTMNNVNEARPLGAYVYSDVPIEGTAASELAVS